MFKWNFLCFGLCWFASCRDTGNHWEERVWLLLCHCPPILNPGTGSPWASSSPGCLARLSQPLLARHILQILNILWSFARLSPVCWWPPILGTQDYCTAHFRLGQSVGKDGSAPLRKVHCVSFLVSLWASSINTIFTFLKNRLKYCRPP